MTFDPNTLLGGNTLGKTPFRRTVVPSGGYLHPSVVGSMGQSASELGSGGRENERAEVASATKPRLGARECCLRREPEEFSMLIICS